MNLLDLNDDCLNIIGAMVKEDNRRVGCRFHTGQFQFHLGWRDVTLPRGKLLIKIVKITKCYIFFQFGELPVYSGTIYSDGTGARFSNAIQKRKIRNLSDLKGEYVEFYRKSYLYYQDGTRHDDLYYWFYRHQGASWSEFSPIMRDEPVGTGNDPNPDLGEPYGYLVYKVKIYASDLETPECV
jgi:hypothetical protein